MRKDEFSVQDQFSSASSSFTASSSSSSSTHAHSSDICSLLFGIQNPSTEFTSSSSLERKGEGFSCQLHVDIVLGDSLKEGMRETKVEVGVLVLVVVVVLLVVVVVVVEVVVVVIVVVDLVVVEVVVVEVVVVVAVVIVVVVVLVAVVFVVALLLKEVIVAEAVVLVDVLSVVAIEFEEDVVLVGVGSSARLELPKSGINGCRKGGVNMSCQLQAPMLVVLDFQVVLLGDVISLF